jgi:hypothetical protein
MPSLSTSAAELREAFATWAAKREILPALQSNLDVVAAWVDLCAPAGASLANRLLVCRDLGVVFFALDDYSGDDSADFFRQCRNILDGNDAPRDETFLRAYAETVREIETRSQAGERYLQGRRELIEAYLWRDAWKRGEHKSRLPSRSEYLERRRTTIFTRQWIDVWEIVEGCTLSRPERELQPLRDATSVLVDWQIFENEVVSLERDLASGDLNLISLMRDEDGVSLLAAKQKVSTERDVLGVQFEDSLQHLRASASASQNLQRYLQILESSFRGAIAIYGIELGRYTVEDWPARA